MLCRHEGQHTRWVHDARGIPLCKVCDLCEHTLPERYAPEVLGICGRYEDVVDEPIEADDW